MRYGSLLLMAAVLVLGLGVAGCKKDDGPATRPAMKKNLATVRINAGATSPLTDSRGNTWLADTGFADGEIVDRGEIAIEGSKTQAIYRTEHWGMTGFSYPVPNGKYTVRLHFAETYEGVTAKGGRVFDLKVEGKEVKGLDVFAEAGGANKALTKEVAVDVADGKLDIEFIVGTQSPEINGIEIIPAK